MTVAVAVAAVAPAGPERRHGSCHETIDAVAAAAAACHHRETSFAAAAAAAACHRRETSVAATAAAAACHHRETSVAAAAAAAAACHRRETTVAVAAAAAACHHRETSVAAAAAAEACHRREIERGGSMVPPAHPPPAIVSQFHGPCVESRRNGWCFLVSEGSVGVRPKLLFSRHRNVPGAGGNDLNNF